MGSKRFFDAYDFARHDADAYVRCKDCGHLRRFTGWQMVTIFGGPLPLDLVRKRLKCSKCGKRGVVEIAPTPHDN